METNITTLTPTNVENIFTKCLAYTADNPESIIIEGVAHTFAFDKTKTEENKDVIIELLMQLPENFREKPNGGWSFLMACNDINGNLWTGSHFCMEKLLSLGMAIDKVYCLTPREMWCIMPNGMPYYAIKNED